MTIDRQVKQYIHNYIHVFLEALGETNIILSMATIKEIDEFYATVEDLETKDDYTIEELKSVLPLSQYFSSVSSEFVIDLLDSNPEHSHIPSSILKFMYESLEINRILRELK